MQLPRQCRKHLLVDLSRVCVKDYKIPGTNVTVEKGTAIIVPMYAIHHDEQFYPDPDKFDPTRFSSENRSNKSQVDAPYLAFGGGPRACIGQRIGKLFAKVGICSILQQYHVDLDERHIGKELKYALNLRVVDGIHLKIQGKTRIKSEIESFCSVHLFSLFSNTQKFIHAIQLTFINTIALVCKRNMIHSIGHRFIKIVHFSEYCNIGIGLSAKTLIESYHFVQNVIINSCVASLTISFVQ